MFIYSLTSSVNLKSDAYYNRIRPHTIIYDRIRQSYSSVYGLQTVIFKRYPFLTVSLRIRCPCTDPVYDLRISPFFTVNGRLRPCMFDLGIYSNCKRKRKVFSINKLMYTEDSGNAIPSVRLCDHK